MWTNLAGKWAGHFPADLQENSCCCSVGTRSSWRTPLLHTPPFDPVSTKNWHHEFGIAHTAEALQCLKSVSATFRLFNSPWKKQGWWNTLARTLPSSCSSLTSQVHLFPSGLLRFIQTFRGLRDCLGQKSRGHCRGFRQGDTPLGRVLSWGRTGN